MTTADLPDQLELARAAFARNEWAAAARAFVAADGGAEAIGAEDLATAGLVHHLIGDDDGAVAFMSRSHQAYLADGQPLLAARMAFYLGMVVAERGDFAVAGGWLSRAQRLVDDAGVDSIERGYLLLPEAIRLVDTDPATALARFEEAAAIADRFAERDLAEMARLGRGRCLMRLGQIERGVALLDDAMLAVTSGEVGPVTVGIVYCAAIEAYNEIFDLRRAQGWTEALDRWCAEHPDLAPFRGRCLVFRADLMRFHGSWPEADVEVQRAEAWLLRPPPEPAVGEAYYVEAELHRLRGELDSAESAYVEGAKWGRRPEPGLALLRVAQGRIAGALTMIRRAIDETPTELARAPLLEALVEIAIVAGDHDQGRTAADELGRLAGVASAPLLDAIAARADGSASLAAGDARAALAAFRRASELWQALDAPYDLARVRVGIASACRALGDDETAAIQLAAARDVFERLGAVPDLRRVDAIAGEPPPTPGGLSARELEVIRALAAGRTNREIAANLGISERTVDRHVSNIFTKLDVSSRAAATAFAYEHDLV
jgi:DNA-binding CsgD family transcriptional regulator